MTQPDSTAPRLFGTDGVRGLANEILTPDLAMDLARAAGEGKSGDVLIGRDTRRSGDMLNAALKAGFNSVGIDTVDLGIVPVGAVSRLTREARALYGIMVSASHNAAPDNGIKFFSRNGMKISADDEMAIEDRVLQSHPWTSPTGAGVGFDAHKPNATERYVSYLERLAGYSMRGLEVVLDCAQGAAFRAAPMLFENLKAQVEVHNIEPDGTNINHECGATSLGYLQGVAKGRVGLAFDGDADRLIAVDEDGMICDGDVLIAVFAKYLKELGKLPNDTIAVTVMSNLGLHKAMERLGITVMTTDVGDRHVLEAMVGNDLALGGEQSGHIILEERTTGDGLRSGLRLLEVMAATGKPLTELRKVMTEFPQVLQNVVVEDKSGLDGATGIWDAVKDAEANLAGDGRILVRASGTEPKVRVMVEAPDDATASQVAADLAEVVKHELGTG